MVKPAATLPVFHTVGMAQAATMTTQETWQFEQSLARIHGDRAGHGTSSGLSGALPGEAGRVLITHSLSSTIVAVFTRLGPLGVTAIVTESRPL